MAGEAKPDGNGALSVPNHMLLASLHGAFETLLVSTTQLLDCYKVFICCVQAVAVALYNPEAFRAIGQARLDVGRVLPERMSDESYRELLVRIPSSSNFLHEHFEEQVYFAPWRTCITVNRQHA